MWLRVVSLNELSSGSDDADASIQVAVQRGRADRRVGKRQGDAVRVQGREHCDLARYQREEVQDPVSSSPE